jgi:hypothetical protein
VKSTTSKGSDGSTVRETTTSDGDGNKVTRKSVTSSDGGSKTTYTAQSSDGKKVDYSDTSSQSFAETSGTGEWWSRLWTW